MGNAQLPTGFAGLTAEAVPFPLYVVDKTTLMVVWGNDASRIDRANLPVSCNNAVCCGNKGNCGKLENCIVALAAQKNGLVSSVRAAGNSAHGRRVYEFHAAPLGTGEGNFFTVIRFEREAETRVVTERKLSEERLRKSDEQYRALFDTMSQGVIYQDATGSIIAANPAAESILGLTLAQMQGRKSSNPRWKSVREDGTHFPGDVHPAMIALRHGKPVMDVVMGVFNPEIEGYRWFRVDATPEFRDGEMRPFRVYSVMTDITDKRDYEIAQELNKRRLQSLWELARRGDAAISVLSDHILNEIALLTGSPVGFLAFVDAEQATLSVQSCIGCYPPDSKKDTKPAVFSFDKAGPWVESIRSGAETVVNHCVGELSPKHGPLACVPVLRYLAIPVVSGKGVSLLVVVANKGQDYTGNSVAHAKAFVSNANLLLERRRETDERHRLEEQLRQSQKLESLGQLAGGIAHDFNNILGGILGLADMMLPHLEEHPRLHKYTEQILLSTERGAKVVKQMLSFARKSSLDFAELDLDKAAEQVASLLRHTIDPRIEIRVESGAGRKVVNGDPSQIENALLNMGLNARDAMPDGGVLTFTTALSNLSPDDCAGKSAWYRPGSYVRLDLRDTGTGMNPEICQHIFEPFFTTKEAGEGTGLGLASVYGCIKQHDGIIEVNSVPGEGTVFTLYFPRSISSVADEASKPQAAYLSAKKDVRIVVVEDDENMAEMLGDILVEAGYTVHCCKNGREAVDWYEAHRGEADLFILDMVMPRMNGNDCCRRLWEIDGSCRVIVSSGYSMDGQVKKLLSDGAHAFVMKPYRKNEILAAVDSALRKTDRD